MNYFGALSHPRKLVIGAISLVALFLLARFNYLLFHTAAELIIITVTLLVFVLATHSYCYSKDNFFLFLGNAYVFLAILNFFHLVTYYGMGIFPHFDRNPATQFWIALRILNVLTLFIAPFFSKRPYRPTSFFVFYGSYTLLAIASILWLQIFPVCFIEGQGLTSFKVAAEYIIILLFLASLFNMYQHREYFLPTIYKTVMISVIVNIFAEFAFTFYADVYGLLNLLGHLLEICSIYLIFDGIVSQGLKKPFEMIFKKLSTQNEELQRINHYKSDFLASMSHEMRTPLTAILAFGEDLQRERIGTLNLRQKEHVQDIILSGKQLLILINDLLDLSKIESGKMSLTLTEINVEKILAEELSGLRALAQRKALQFQVSVTSIRDIVADEYKIRQVLRNLLGNAIKFSPMDSEIKIRIQKVTQPQEGILIEIEDAGIGIPADELEKVFEMFYQVEKGSTKKYGGTGLGLALVKKLLELHHGTIRLKSVEGEGCTFSVFLPQYPDLDRDLL